MKVDSLLAVIQLRLRSSLCLREIKKFLMSLGLVFASVFAELRLHFFMFFEYHG